MTGDSERSQPSVVPAWYRRAFICPHCGIASEQDWEEWGQFPGDGPQLAMATCGYCSEGSLWESKSMTMTGEEVNQVWGDDRPSFLSELLPGLFEIRHASMLYPAVGTGPGPSEFLPASAVDDYNEARQVANKSPRSAAALLRLALQKLVNGLGYDTGTLADCIQQMIEDRHLPERVIKACGIVRITGNESVHPGTLSLKDDPTIVEALFSLVNYIADETIGRTAEIDAMWEAMPEGPRLAVEKKNPPPELPPAE